MGHDNMDKKISPVLLISILLTAVTLLIAWQRNDAFALILATPFSILAYLLYFSVGTESFVQGVKQWCDESLMRYLALPLAMVVVLYLYVGLGDGSPLQGNSWQIPLLFCAPVLFYRLTAGSGAAITWRDVIGTLLCIMPYVLHDYPFNSSLPTGGGGIETLYLLFAIVILVYSLVSVRRLQNVGFSLYYSTAALKKVLTGWVLFFLIVLVIGIPTGFMKWVGYEPVTPALVVSGLALFLRTLFGTALPEELIFRGALMNLLQQRIQQTGNVMRYMYGSLLLLPLAVAAGYTTEDKMQWFPLLCTIILWVMTNRLNRRRPEQASVNTALLIVSTLFGLGHYHIHSTIFMGLAIIAGWVFGHVYLKTGSVFYSALTHTLVNVSPALFGFVLIT